MISAAGHKRFYRGLLVRAHRLQMAGSRGVGETFRKPAEQTQKPPLRLLCWLTKRFTNAPRSEEHTSELQSQSNLVCRLLLEKKIGVKVGSAPGTTNPAGTG